MALLIDTSVIIGLERHGRGLASLDAARDDEPLAVAAVTASELLVGVYRAGSPERRSRRQAIVEGILLSVPVLPFDLAAARVHARLLAEMLSAGQRIGSHDLLIAATALAKGYDLLTANVRDFRRVPGLVVRELVW